MHRTIITTGADAAYFAFAQEAIRSIRDRPEGRRVAVGFVDLGCLPEQLDWLRQHVDHIVHAAWPADFGGADKAPDYMRIVFYRSALPRHFEGYDVYLWIDADAWVQDWRSVELFTEGALRRGLAVVPELDRASRLQYGGLPDYWRWAAPIYDGFGPGLGARFGSYPMINAGVFALARDAPHWAVWQGLVHRATREAISNMTDQFALNLTVYDRGLMNDTELLPAWCNWTCHFGLPAWDEAQELLVEPYLPHTPIGIVHLTGTKQGPVRLATPDRAWVERSIRYAGPA